MYSSNLIKSDEELRCKIRDFNKFRKEDSKTNLQNQKSLDLDQYSQRNQRAKADWVT